MAMSSGQFNRLLEVRRETPTDDGMGNYTSGDYAKAFEVMAEVREAKGGDIIRAGRITGKGAVEIRVRQTDKTRTITTFDRLYCPRFRKTYHISHIADLEGSARTYLFTCVEYR